MDEIDRSILIHGCLLGPNSMAGLDSVADLQRLGLERFHCIIYTVSTLLSVSQHDAWLAHGIQVVITNIGHVGRWHVTVRR